MKHILITVIALTLMIGCGSRSVTTKTIVENKPQSEIKRSAHQVKQSKLPPAPKKKFKPKEVKDTNYADNYMYPEDSAAAKKDPTVPVKTPTVTSNAMTKQECVAMISQEKFDKYTAMFGNEASSIKRCAMLKAMQK